jgi:CDP-4-dehydro-6-deoxyglucose reductase, E1
MADATNKMTVPFGTITISQMAKDLINECLDTTRISSGKLVREFEDKFAKLIGVEETVAVSSGTDADVLALAVLHDFGAKRDDEVIIPALSFVATGNAVLHAGFQPKFVDVERHTLNIDPALIEAAITDRTRAIMPVHLMGKPAKMDEIMTIAQKHDLKVIEDAAEAHGAFYKGKAAGSIGDMGAFSLYVAHIITSGEGGLISTNNPDYAEILRSLRSHGRACKCKVCAINTKEAFCQKRFAQGQDIRFMFERIGYSCKMNELEAAIGLGAIADYEGILKKRHDNLIHVLDRFDQFSPYLFSIKEEEHEQIGPHAIPIIVGEEATFTRETLAKYLEDHNIAQRALFQSMPTQVPGFAYQGHTLGDFPNTEYLADNGVHIGTHQDLEIEHMDYILETLGKFLEQHQN